MTLDGDKDRYFENELSKLDQEDLERFQTAAERSLEPIDFKCIEEDAFSTVAGVFLHRGDAHSAWDNEVFGDAFAAWGAVWITFDDWPAQPLDPATYQTRLAELSEIQRRRALNQNDRQPTQDILHLPATLINIEAYLDGTAGPEVLQALLTNNRPAANELPFRHRRRTSQTGKNENRARHRNAQFKTSPVFIITQTGDYFVTPKPRFRFIPRQVHGSDVIEHTMGSIQRQYRISESFRGESRRNRR